MYSTYKFLPSYQRWVCRKRLISQGLAKGLGNQIGKAFGNKGFENVCCVLRIVCCLD